MPTQKRPSTSFENFEKTLIAARDGEQAQLGVLLDVYRGYLLTVANEKLSKDIVAKAAPSDLVQETLLIAYQAFREFRGSTEPELRIWLNQILVRKVIDVHRHYLGFAKRDISREVPLSDVIRKNDASLGAAAACASPSQLASQVESSRTFDDALGALKEEQRQAIQLRSIEQLSFEEAGVRLGRSPKTVRKLWTQAIRNLTLELQSHHSGD